MEEITKQAEKICFRGIRMRNDRKYTEAIDLFRQAARMGNAEAMRLLGSMYEKGDGCIADLEKAKTFYEDALDHGDLYAGSALNKLKEEIEYRKSMDLPLRDLETIYQLGETLFNTGGDGFFELYLEAARYGHARAMFRVGYCYANGLETAANDQDAFWWYDRSAQAGDPYGLYYSAVCYANGRGCRFNMEKALLYARKSRKAGNPDAANLIPEITRLMDVYPDRGQYRMMDHKLSDMKELRHSVSRIVNRDFTNDELEAHRAELEQMDELAPISNEATLALAFKRANLGDDQAMLQLAAMYLSQDPDEVNPSQDHAYYWLMKAAKSGNIDAFKYLIVMFTGNQPGEELQDYCYEDCIPLEEDTDFAWNLVRMLAWIHLDGLLTIREWTENGTFLDKPDYVELLETCKSILSYRVIPKRYQPEWRDRYHAEQKKHNAIRADIYITLMQCFIRIQGEDKVSLRYTREAREWILRAVEEKADIFDELAILFIAEKRRDLLKFAAANSKVCSLVASEIFRTGKAESSYTGYRIEMEPSFKYHLRYRFYYFAVQKDFVKLLNPVVHMLKELYQANSAESMLHMAETIHSFNGMLAENGISGIQLEPEVIELLAPKSGTILDWSSRSRHFLKMHILHQLMEAATQEEIDRIVAEGSRSFKRMDLCYPSPDALFESLPVASVRPSGFTYYEELIHRNYDLSGADFSSEQRLDVFFDKNLWEAAHNTRIYVGRKMAENAADWDLPAGMDVTLDNCVEDYLNRSQGRIEGYWPGLLPIDIIHYSRIEGENLQEGTRSFTYMDVWERVSESGSAAAAYVEALSSSNPDSPEFHANLILLYRYICFRGLWYEAVSASLPERREEILSEWKLIYQHFAELVQEPEEQGDKLSCPDYR